jgi:hypothetical protein
MRIVTLDYKKEYKNLYLPKEEPELIRVPAIKFFAVEGSGDPNEEGGSYSKAVEILYALSYAVKMSGRGDYSIDGFFDYVVPPLEGLWWMDDTVSGIDYRNKSAFHWISMIRQPDFVTEKVHQWAVSQVMKKKKADASASTLWTYEEGLCVQIMHRGSFDDEPGTILKLENFLKESNYRNDIGALRKHHEIYLSDPRKSGPEKMKTVIRHPIAEK